MKTFLRFMKPGDWAMLLLAAAGAAALAPIAFSGGVAEKAVVRRDGVVVAELPLTQARRIEVTGAMGAMGTTVIEVQPGRARVAADPGPRQYCVRQGWLTQPNAIAICAPSHISLSIAGRSANHDSLAY
ncbi:MAG: NusG domain II-containing protein [Gallionellaceae bacterium]|nr:NusG domain II-containing protein [Gallionellaceae bacterium]